MARSPIWFEHLEVAAGMVRESTLEWFGKREVTSIFRIGERDAIRLLHKFGATERNNALLLSRSALLAQLEAVRGGGAYEAFRRRRAGVAEQLVRARTELAARHFRVAAPSALEPRRLGELPSTIRWRRTCPAGPGRFEIEYHSGGDLLGQIAEFLRSASAEREAFFLGTEPGEAV